MTTFFVWIESFSSPPAGADPRITVAVEQLPLGPTQRLVGLRISDEKTAKCCALLRQQNGIQVSIEGEHTLQFIVDKALAKIAKRHASPRRTIR
ncbi:MAG TPA: hypothetical protein VN612_09010 [Acidobacteriaceae bacterium]|nr:hypothetical protein [Acidobacteriaceae bacterium]